MGAHLTYLQVMVVLAAAILIVSLRYLGRLDEWHHGYLLLAALPLPDYLEFLRWVPGVIGIEDSIQHLVQAIQKKRNRIPSFMGPFHWAAWKLGMLNY